MTPTTEIVRDQAFLVMGCDIPAGMTIPEYRAQRPRRPGRWERARAATAALPRPRAAVRLPRRRRSTAAVSRPQLA